MKRTTVTSRRYERPHEQQPATMAGNVTNDQVARGGFNGFMYVPRLG